VISLSDLRARIFTRRVGIAVVYLGATVLARAGAVLLVPLYTRRLTLAEYGDFALAQTLVAFLSTPIALGMHAAVGKFYFDLKDIAASRERVGSAARWLVVVTLTLAVLLESAVLLTRPAGSPGLFGRWELSCIVLGAAGASIGQVPTQYYKVAQRPFAAAAFQLTEFFVTVGSGLLMVLKLGRGLTGAVEALAMSGVAMGIVATLFVVIALKGPLALSTLREAVRFSIPFVPHAAGNQIQFVADRWVMKLTGQEAALGAYALANQLTTPVAMAVDAWHNASGPQMGEASREGGIPAMAARSRAYQRSYVLIAIAATAVLCLLLPVAVLLVGKSFKRALWLIPLICVSITIESLYFANAIFLTYGNKTSAIPKITVSAGVLNVVLNLALISTFGVGGAIAARMCATTYKATATWWVARQLLRESA
jgi:O-antigen/teichoic acid export membrane protein